MSFFDSLSNFFFPSKQSGPDWGQIGKDVISGLPVVGGLVKGGLDLFDWGYNKYQQQQQWNREDTAVQRRVADLKAAGLSPVLAAGSAAPTSVVAQRNSAPDFSEGVIKALGTRQAQANIAKTEADADLSRMQAMKAQTESQWFAQNAQNEAAMKRSQAFRMKQMNEYLPESVKKDYDILVEEFTQAQNETQRQKVALEMLKFSRDMMGWDKVFQYGGDLFGGILDTFNVFKPRGYKRIGF